MGSKKFYKHHGNASPVTAAAIAIATIARGVTLHTTTLEFRTSAGVLLTVNEMKSDVEYITIKDGANEVVNQISGTDLLELEEYLTESNEAGYITIYHALPNFDKQQGVGGIDALLGKELLAYGTADRGDLTVYVKVASGSTALAGGTISVDGYVTLDGRKRGAYIKLQNFNREFSSTGRQEISDLPKSSMDSAYMLKKWSKSTLSAINLKVNGVDLLEDATKQILERTQKLAGRTLIANKFHVDFMHDNIIRVDDFLAQRGLTEMRYDIEWTTAPGSHAILCMELVDISKQSK
jgi:hypothetical protein